MVHNLKHHTITACDIELEVEVPTVILRIPTMAESSNAWQVAMGDRVLNRVRRVRWQRALLLRAIVGWSGVRINHVLPGRDGELTFDPKAIAILLNAQPEWEEILIAALLEELFSRMNTPAVASSPASEEAPYAVLCEEKPLMTESRWQVVGTEVSPASGEPQVSGREASQSSPWARRDRK